jgi:hypothetical protein
LTFLGWKLLKKNGVSAFLWDYKSMGIELFWNKKQNQRHITNGNCSPPCSGGSGSAKPQSG